MKTSTTVFVNYQSYTDQTREPDSDDDWDRGNSDTTWDVLGLSLTKNACDDWAAPDQDEQPVDFPVSVGDTLFLLYAVYSTGDSFGDDENGRIEFIGIYKTREKAEKAKDILADAGRRAEIKTESGKTLSVYVPWNGYFEELSWLTIDEFVVKE